MFINTKEIKKMPYTSISVTDKTLYVRKIKVAENMEIEIIYKDKYFNYSDEIYKITVSPNGITRELIGDEIYWTSYNNNTNDTFLVLKDGVVVKEETEEEVEEEVEEETDYESDSTEIVYSSDEEEEPVNPLAKRTTAFLVFASENKKDKTDLSIMNLGPSSINNLNWLTEIGELWKDLSEEDHANYAKKAQLINKHYAEFVDLKLD